MLYILLGLFSALIVGLDQLTKYLTVAYIPLWEHRSFLPGVLGLTYTQNTGAAFSVFQGQYWLFFLIFALFCLFIVWSVWKKLLPFTTFELWCLAAIFGGGLGNLLDRVFRGYVVDMLETDFMTFPIFNVADCFITCGTILLLIHVLFFNKEFLKSEKKGHDKTAK